VDYRVEELAAAAGIRVDTLRFYQARGILLPPRRQGRIAVYGDDHLARLRRIRELKRDGFSLAQIQKVMAESAEAGESKAGSNEPLLDALVEARVGARTLSREEFAEEAGIPEALVRAAESTGLIAPLSVADEDRFTEADLEVTKSALFFLESGIPLQALLETAQIHVANIEKVCDMAIDLFDDHVRKAGPAADNSDAITGVFRDLLPQVTKVVALHFQRTLVNRALKRLEGVEEFAALEAALSATDSTHLEVEWR
jgi:DNA-binding transcriptional MerR regulator